MANDARWTLERLVDLEQAAAASTATPQNVRSEVAAAIRGLDGAAARRKGLEVWLDTRGTLSGGAKFTASLAMVGGGFSALAFLAGISAVLGLLDRGRGGINVTLFLAILIGGQWLVLLLAGMAWLFRRRAAEGFSGVQALAGKLARRLAGDREGIGWHQLMDAGGAARAAVLWRLARMAQAAGVCFNGGILTGLAGLVLLKHVGFFWETTTELAMRSALTATGEFLAIPWSEWWRDAVPDDAVIQASQWLPGRVGVLAPGPAAWWKFLLMATLVWGLLPRALLWLLASHGGRRALADLDFQARHHRVLWREITGTGRVETDEKPLDGVLVLDVGGSGLTEQALRPFLLRRLRVHPASWKSVAVLDAGAEAEAARALSGAPAGVVFLAEGWSLSPARMLDLHGKVRASAGPDIPVKFLIANQGAGELPASATDDEKNEWSRFVDSLRDPAAEIYFYEQERPDDGVIIATG